jgi:cellulose synthase/poly-beta-1,6-N-acetylglucosamine synthase-like glycosyltransferase
MYKVIFFAILFIVLYSYLIYPCILLGWSNIRKRKKPSYHSKEDIPYITVIIAAHNEEKVIKNKILNSLKLDYPSDKIEIIIGSDGSTDGTDEICKQFKDIRFIRIESRCGKANVLNTLVPLARGEIILFSDANTILEPESLIKTVQHFSDLSIGSVCGKLILKNKKSNLASYERIYWQYESMIKGLEGRIYSTIGANGGIYAIRRGLYSKIPEDTIIDDFTISLNILEKGKRIIFEENAIAYEYVSKNFIDEFWRKVRIGAGNLQVVIRKRRIFKRLSPFVKFAFLSHKLARWVIPLLLILLYVSCLKLYGQGFFTYFFWIYNLGIIIALFGIIRQTNNKIINIISYLFSFNFALLLGYLRYIFNLQKVTWRRAVR